MNKFNRILLALIIILVICILTLGHYYLEIKTAYSSMEESFVQYERRKDEFLNKQN